MQTTLHPSASTMQAQNLPHPQKQACELHTTLEGSRPTPENYDRIKRTRFKKASQGELVSPAQLSVPSASAQSWLKSFAKQILAWLQNLNALHACTKDIPGESVIRLTLTMYRLHIQQGGPHSRLPFCATAAACFWIAIKFLAARCTVPNTHLLCHITGVHKAELLPAEMAVLKSLGWSLYSVAKSAGVLDEEE